MNERIYYSEDARQQAMRERTFLLTLTMAVGAVVGAGLTWLLTTDRGEKMRQQAQAALEESYQQGQEATEEALARLEEEIPHLRERVAEEIDRVGQRLPEWRKKVDGKIAHLTG